MSAQVHDLVLTPEGVTGRLPEGFDVALWSDVARALAACCKAWAEGSAWTSLSGFDSGGCFILTAHSADTLRFRRSAVSAGWYRRDECPPDSADLHFPCARTPAHFDHFTGFQSLRSWLLSQRSFAGFAVRSPKTGLWKPVLCRATATGGSASVAASSRLLTPVVKIAGAQGLPWSRLTLRSSARTAYLFRTPSKLQGAVIHAEPHDARECPVVVDALATCIAREDIA